MSEYWQAIIDLLYDAINSEFYTDEEREDKIEEAFEDFAGFTYDVSDVPINYTRRANMFYSPIDLIYWIEDAGIPVHYVYVHSHSSVRDGSSQYNAYISST